MGRHRKKNMWHELHPKQAEGFDCCNVTKKLDPFYAE
jgi:hypothetical protein